ncbi:MAG TPA: ATP-dependent DNA ligase [Anaeromyxobacter sp.]|nr:ATP-dependent DNA ligase [Anaeromyxobacter sp.]
MAWPPLDLPITPPYPPMEARLDDALPAGASWWYEPKWDGFRCLAFKDGGTVVLQSKAGQPLGRYFPEIVAAVAALPAPRLVLDGELVIPAGGGVSFEAMLQRIHPAESRIRKLAAETPARLVLFDLLVDARGRALVSEPLEARRAALEADGPRPGAEFVLSPVTRDRAAAEAWLAGRAGTDGVVAKRLGVPYASGDRTAMVKVKRERTADCVVAGFRRGKDGRDVASLLLGLYGDDGRLHYAGHASSFGREERARLTALVEPLAAGGAPRGGARGGEAHGGDPQGGRADGFGFTGEAPGGPSRWARGRSTEWTAVRPVLVVEVGWKHASGGRFRHGVRLLRFRPDKAPEQCTFAQLGAAPSDDGEIAPR